VCLHNRRKQQEVLRKYGVCGTQGIKTTARISSRKRHIGAHSILPSVMKAQMQHTITRHVCCTRARVACRHFLDIRFSNIEMIPHPAKRGRDRVALSVPGLPIRGRTGSFKVAKGIVIFRTLSLYSISNKSISSLSFSCGHDPRQAL